MNTSFSECSGGGDMGGDGGGSGSHGSGGGDDGGRNRVDYQFF